MLYSNWDYFLAKERKGCLSSNLCWGYRRCPRIAVLRGEDIGKTYT